MAPDGAAAAFLLPPAAFLAGDGEPFFLPLGEPLVFGGISLMIKRCVRVFARGETLALKKVK